ncbi:hypothetical protein [uncultured Microscilla sp.]|uniref:hypothetical protein n=1 Tax=uncultured Microscilla sp. TaxID=432653 RepID=UPI002632EAB5|nr:hypothetical protein [uncultured Microscilla sp.]
MTHDILINYVEKDDQVDSEQQTGWVSSFKRFLNMVLSQLLQEHPKIALLDSQLLQDSTSLNVLNQTKVLVTIVSPEYVQVPIQEKVINTFFEVAQKQPDLPAPDKRCFKVVKYPVAYDSQPLLLKPLLNYNLFYLNRETGEEQEFEDFFSSIAEKNYWTSLVDLAYDIYHVLTRFDKKQAIKNDEQLLEGIIGEGDNTGTVYLAETSQELTIQRTIIKRELQRHGYQVLPNYTLPNDVEKLEQAVLADLKRSLISIHLIGREYGENIKGGEVSVIELQNKLASEYSQQQSEGTEKFSRLIWLPPSLIEASERQQRFIENLRENAQGLSNAEILQIPLEDFKTTIRKSLTDSPVQMQERDHAPKTSTNKLQVYLIFDRVDTQPALLLMEHLQAQGFYVITPMLMGSILEVRQQHIEGLKYCDVALVLAEKADEQWVKVKLKDLVKAPGFGRERPMRAKILLAINDYHNITKEDLKTYNVRKVENIDLNDFSAEFTFQNILNQAVQNNQS